MLGEGSEVVDAEEQYAEERDGMVHTYMITVGMCLRIPMGLRNLLESRLLRIWIYI